MRSPRAVSLCSSRTSRPQCVSRSRFGSRLSHRPKVVGAITSIAHESAARFGTATAIRHDNGTRLPLTLSNAHLRDNLEDKRSHAVTASTRGPARTTGSPKRVVCLANRQARGRTVAPPPRPAPTSLLAAHGGPLGTVQTSASRRESGSGPGRSLAWRSDRLGAQAVESAPLAQSGQTGPRSCTCALAVIRRVGFGPLHCMLGWLVNSS